MTCKLVVAKTLNLLYPLPVHYHFKTLIVPFIIQVVVAVIIITMIMTMIIITTTYS